MGGKAKTVLPVLPLRPVLALPPRKSRSGNAGGRIRTVDPALMRRVLSPTELPRQRETRILPYAPYSMSGDEHRIAVAIEAIAAGDGIGVRLHDGVASGKRGDEHEER